MPKNLYLVTLQKSSYQFHVIAENPDEAYQKVRYDLEKQDYGYTNDRRLKTIELLAEEKQLPDSEDSIKKLYI